MNDQVDLMESSKPVASKAASKPSRPPKKKGAEASTIQGSRVAYKDRKKISANDRDPAFHYRVFNTDNEKYSGRLDEALSMGYIFANDGESLGDDQGVEAGSVGNSIGRHVGHGTRGVLMKIPKEYYEEDQAAKQAEVDQTEFGMVDDELKNASDMYGEGLKVADGKGTRLETKVRN